MDGFTETPQSSSHSVTQPSISIRYCRGLSISSLFVLECNFHVEYKWVLVNVSMTHGRFWGGTNNLVLEQRALYGISTFNELSHNPLCYNLTCSSSAILKLVQYLIVVKGLGLNTQHARPWTQNTYSIYNSTMSHIIAFLFSPWHTTMCSIKLKTHKQRTTSSNSTLGLVENEST